MLSIIAVLAALPDQVPGQFVGARGALAAVAKPSPLGSDPEVRFEANIADFVSNEPMIAAERAADGWIALVVEAFAMNDRDTSGFASSSFRSTVPAIPRPESWPLIAAKLGREVPGVSTDRRKILLLMMDALQGNLRSVQDKLKEFQTRPARQRASGYDPNPGYYIGNIRLQLAERMRNPDAIEAAIRDEVAEHLENPVVYSNFGAPSMRIPDLIGPLGRERARKLLEFVLLNAKVELVFDGYQRGGDRTEDIARQVMMSIKDRVAWPQWTLATSPQAGDIFEIFRRRFPKATLGITWSNPPSGSSLNFAADSCLVNLFLAGDVEHAKRFAVSNATTIGEIGWMRPSRFDDNLLSDDKAKRYATFLRPLALQFPESALAQEYLRYVRPFETLEKYRRILRTLQTRSKASWAKNNYQIEIGQVNVNLGDWNAVMADAMRPPRSPGNGNDDSLLIDLGEYLHRPELIKTGLDRVAHAQESFFSDDDLVDMFFRNGRGPQLERILIDRIRKAIAPTEGSGDAQSDAIMLASLYFKSGRYQDVVTLLDRFPNWNAEDLGELPDRSYLQVPLLYLASFSLAKVGRMDYALTVLKRQLEVDPQEDEDYGLMLNIAPSSAEANLGALAREYPYNSRPVLWNARRLLRGGDAKAAAAAARQAIALDPDDLGAWQQPTRFAAYAVLADAERALGHTANAKSLGRFQTATRLEYQAARLDGNRLRPPAIAAYKQALAILPDDFRARVELGRLLIGAGDRAGGTSELREAFSHLPSKINSIDTLGYSYVGELSRNGPAFAILRQQEIAGSRNANVYALIGQALETEGKIDKALEEYRKAMKLDVGCVLAQRRIIALAPNSDPFSREIILKLRSLDQVRDTWYGDQMVTDYKQEWLDAATVATRRLGTGPKIYELRASRALLETNANANYLQNRRNGTWQEQFPPPAQRIAADPLIQPIISAIDAMKG